MPAPENTDPDRHGDVSSDENRRRVLAEQVGLLWERAGSPRMDGRVLGYLIYMSEPYISSADLGRVLGTSAGSISMSTRRLVDAGYINRHVVPGDRSHYFRADDDPWGALLASERRFLHGYSEMFDASLAQLGDDDHDARRRVINARDYMAWLIEYNSKMLQDWAAFKAARDEGNPDASRP
ncbi:MAG: MarR family transcriptional regulator [Microbacteriaceae bacterium]